MSWIQTTLVIIGLFTLVALIILILLWIHIWIKVKAFGCAEKEEYFLLKMKILELKRWCSFYHPIIGDVCDYLLCSFTSNDENEHLEYWPEVSTFRNFLNRKYHVDMREKDAENNCLQGKQPANSKNNTGQ